MKDIFISHSTSIIDALKKLDITSEKTLLVVENGKLLGTITDGDIRRYIIKTGNLKGNIEACFNPNPITISNGEATAEMAREIMIRYSIQVIPVIDDEKNIIDYYTWKQLFGLEFKKNQKYDLNIPAVIMAGGKGTRLDPFTKILPKPLIPIGNKSILELIIESFLEYGIRKFYITVNYKSEMIIAYFNGLEKNYDIEFIKEEEFLGTAGSLFYLKERIESDFILSNCDVLLKTNYFDAYNYHKKNDSMITLLTSIQHYKIPYGVVESYEGGEIGKILEKPEYTFQISTGIYLVNNTIFSEFNKAEFKDMPDLIKIISSKTHKVFSYPVNTNDFLDIGQWEDYKRAIQKIEGTFNV